MDCLTWSGTASFQSSSVLPLRWRKQWLQALSPSSSGSVVFFANAASRVYSHALMKSSAAYGPFHSLRLHRLSPGEGHKLDCAAYMYVRVSRLCCPHGARWHG